MTNSRKTLTDSMTGSTMTEPLIGNCTNHVDPDLWQPEPPNGRPSVRMMGELAGRIVLAKTICGFCPSSDRCLEFGNQPNDLPYGIWGGKMAGERILDLGHKRSDLLPQSDLGKAIDFYERMKPYIERVENEYNQVG